MCGIVAYIGGQDATPIVVDGLKKLEYRGYDSAGIAILDDGKIEIRRAAGKVALLETLIEKIQSREPQGSDTPVGQRMVPPASSTPTLISGWPAGSSLSITASLRTIFLSRKN